MVSPTFFFFPLRTISCPKGDEARPVISTTTSISFLIEHNKSVQLGGFLRAQALKFPFFLLSFSFGNEREENSARRANPARLRAITKAGVQCSHSLIRKRSGLCQPKLLLRIRHAEGIGAPHPSPIGDTFPSRGRLHYASKFYVNTTRVRRSCIPTIGMQASR